MTFWDVIAEFFKALFSFDQAHPLLFTQFYFWAFFALVFAAFSLFHSKILLRNAYLFAVSLFFYYKTSGVFLALLLFVIVYNYFSGRWIHRARRGGWKTAFMVVAIVVDMGLLAYFKYAYFLVDMVNDLLGTHIAVHDVMGEFFNIIAGRELFRIDAIILPVGISFFTFQAVSYVVDVRKGKIDPVRNFFDFGFFLSFFPQLVAGPIVRATEFIPQIHRPYNLSRRWFGIAVFWIMNGMVKKIVLSDYIAVNFCDRVFENPLMYSGFENLSALFCYSLQVYADFSGYTDIATGVAMLMGFYLPKNFDSPYKATNVQDFWRRWHLTLSRWLRDYLYIPLGGNRKATAGTYIILFIVAVVGSFLSGSWWVAAAIAAVSALVGLLAWLRPQRRKLIVANLNSINTKLLGGLWHGASWNFMIWGGLNGIGQTIYTFWHKWSMGFKMAVITGTAAVVALLKVFVGSPVWNLFFVWVLLIWAGTAVRYVYSLVHKGEDSAAVVWIGKAWAIAQTFVFITFTRLFFRSGSNLDPALANEQAWATARNMVTQIGSAWNVPLLPMLKEHWAVLALFAAGMLIHWIPERTKRWYRISFSRLPLGLMAVVVVLTVFFFYQFITADLQSFIYFQF